MDSLDVLNTTATAINGLNLYMYCGDNPIMRTDKTGKNWWNDLWDGIGKGINYIGNIIGSGLELIGSVIVEIPSFVNALFGSGFNFLTGSNSYYDFGDWQLGRGQRINNVFTNFINAFAGNYQALVWNNLTNAFWGTVDFLGDNFNSTLTIGAEVFWLFGPWGMVASGIISLLLMLYDMRNKENIIQVLNDNYNLLPH